MCQVQWQRLKFLTLTQLWSHSSAVSTLSLTDLVEELLPCGVGVEGKLQLRVHTSDAHIDLQRKKKNFKMRHDNKNVLFNEPSKLFRNIFHQAYIFNLILGPFFSSEFGHICFCDHVMNHNLFSWGKNMMWSCGLFINHNCSLSN